MIRATMLVALAACNLGIGSDPSIPLRCLPAHAEATGCFLPDAPIRADGVTVDWATVEKLAVEATCVNAPCDGLLPLELSLAGNDWLAIRARFGAALDATLRAAIILEPSPARPASGGIDHVTSDSYEKNGFSLAPAGLFDALGYAVVPTSDGFEARIESRWLTHQGASLVSVTIERLVGETWQTAMQTAPVPACWGFRDYPSACEDK